MASLDITGLDSVLKQHYLPLKVQNMVYDDEPFLAWLPKYTKFGGKNLPIPIQFAVPAGRSASFATAQANATASEFEDFLLTRVSDYAVAHIDNEAMEASMGDANAFLQATVTEINGAIRAAQRSLASALPRAGTGSIGVIKAATNPNTTIELATPSDITNFEIGMTLVASAADGGALGSAETTVVTHVDRTDGILTVATDVDGLTHDWEPGDYLYVQGDAQNGGTKVKVTGLDGWFPSSDPSSTAFFGVDRSVDPTRLGGVRYSAANMSIEEGLISAAARVQREGGRPDVVWMNPEEWVKLVKELGSNITYNNVESSNGKISFRAIELVTPRGTMNVLSDHNFPMGVAYMLQKSTVKLYSLGEAPKILTYGDGAGQYLRRSAADGVEVRVGYYAQFGSTAPGYNCRITLPS
jgi:hypothetical protein